MNIVHDKCGGTVVPDISSFLYLRAPSSRLTLSGIELGPIEIAKRTGKFSMVFSCLRCMDTIQEDGLDSLVMECQVCRERFPVTKLNTCEGFSCICSDCVAILKNGQTTSKSSAQIRKLLRFINLPKDYKLKSLLDVFKSIRTS